MDDSGLRLIEEPSLRTLFSVPSAAAPASGWPVLCFLHGYDEAAPLDIQAALTRHGPLSSASASLAREAFILVAPQLPAAGDHWHRHAAEVQDLVRRLHEQHDGNPQQTYLSGFSFGGNGVFDLAIAQPGTWAALWPVDPTRVPREDPRCPVWLSFGEAARRNKSGFVRSLGLQAVGSMPEEEGERLYLDEGEDHVGSARRAYADERIYRWLLSISLAESGATRA
ncbi:hypothetical protein GCM10027040_35490 [Halomonas shantousis]